MELRVDCPFCHRRGKTRDRKRHLHINTEKNYAHCFKCNYGTRDAKAMATRENLDLDTTNWTILEPTAPVARGCTLPEGFRQDFHATEMGQRALQYLLARQLTPTTISAYGLGYCESGPARGRIVVPIYESGTLVTWQGRDFLGTSDIKYLGPKGAGRNSLYNLDRAGTVSVLVLVEGPFDVLRLPEFAVGLLGKGWNDDKRRKILQARPAVVLICLDADAKLEEQAIHEDLAGCVPLVKSYHLPTKDLGDAPEPVCRKLANMCRAFARLAAPPEPILQHAGGYGTGVAP